jgi:hypothetical protein
MCTSGPSTVTAATRSGDDGTPMLAERIGLVGDCVGDEAPPLAGRTPVSTARLVTPSVIITSESREFKGDGALASSVLFRLSERLAVGPIRGGDNGKTPSELFMMSAGGVIGGSTGCASEDPSRACPLNNPAATSSSFLPLGRKKNASPSLPSCENRECQCGVTRTWAGCVPATRSTPTRSGNT